MKQINAISVRTRILALVTGLLTTSLFFMNLWTLWGSGMLVLGAVLVSRSPRPAKWLIWMGAAGWSMTLIPYTVLFLHNFPSFNDPNFHSRYAYSWIHLWAPLLASTILIIWCDAELIIESVRGIRVSQSRTATRFRLIWIFAVALNLWTLSTVVFAVIRYEQPKGIYLMLMCAGWLIVTLIFDLLLVTDVISRKFARPADEAAS